MYIEILPFLLFPTSVMAFSASTLGLPLPSGFAPEDPTIATSNEVQALETTSWRLVLDIGREPLSSMPFDWARSGCRMPLVIPCDFSSDQFVLPRSDVVSFTGPNGAVQTPVEGGTWSLNRENNQDTLRLDMHFPERFARRDVYIDAGTTLSLATRVFRQSELDQLNQEFYDARERTWKIGGELNEMSRRQEAPKKWNEEKGRWEKRYANESMLEQMQKRAAYYQAQTVQKQKANQRPNLNELSTGAGHLPGVDENLYVQQQGLVVVPKGGGWRGDAVIGRWSAEPITDPTKLSRQ